MYKFASLLFLKLLKCDVYHFVSFFLFLWKPVPELIKIWQVPALRATRDLFFNFTSPDMYSCINIFFLDIYYKYIYIDVYIYNVM